MRDTIVGFFRSKLGIKPRHILLGWLFLLVGCLSLVGGSAFAYVALASDNQSTPAAPADLFMQSVVKRDGGLGWNQLCPAMQAQLPKIELIRQADSQRASDQSQGVSLSMESLGTHPMAQGDKLHLYLVTARKPGGWEYQRMYAVWTQKSGCVEDVQYLDPPMGDGN
jgi:hypothetical protein